MAPLISSIQTLPIRASQRTASPEPLPPSILLPPRFPTELLLKLSSHLPSPNQGCLALTCKELFNIFGSVLEAEELRLPGVDLTIDESDKEDASGEDGSDEESDSSDFDEENESDGEGDSDSDEEEEDGNTEEEDPEWYSRIHLLCLLEDNKWACCAHCQKLHSRKEFPAGELSSTPSRRRCAKYARLLDICPCIILTPRDRARIVRYLQRTSEKQPLSLIDKGLLKDAKTEKEGDCLSHECGAYQNIRAEMRFYLRKGAKLFVRTRFKIPSSVSEANTNIVYICPEEDLGDSLLEMEDFGAPESRNCYQCPTHIKLLSSEPELKVVQTTRCLGKGEWPYDRYDSELLSQGREYIFIYLH